MRINLIYVSWDQITFMKNLQCRSVYLDQCSACITTLPIEKLFSENAKQKFLNDLLNFFISLSMCRKKQPWLSMLLSQCPYCPVIFFDSQMSGHCSYIFLNRYSTHRKCLRNFYLFVNTFTFFLSQTGEALSPWREKGADATGRECLQLPAQLLPGSRPRVQLPPGAGPHTARLRWETSSPTSRLNIFEWPLSLSWTLSQATCQALLSILSSYWQNSRIATYHDVTNVIWKYWMASWNSAAFD